MAAFKIILHIVMSIALGVLCFCRIKKVPPFEKSTIYSVIIYGAFSLVMLLIAVSEIVGFIKK